MPSCSHGDKEQAAPGVLPKKIPKGIDFGTTNKKEKQRQDEQMRDFSVHEYCQKRPQKLTGD